MARVGFLKRLLQSIALSLLTMIVVIAVIGGIAYLALNREAPIKKGSWLVLDLSGDLPAYTPAGSFPGSLLAGDTMTLQDALDAMGKAALDRRVAGVVWKLSAGPGAGWAKLQELRDGIRAVRDAGKPVYAWAETLDLPTLYLAAACDSVYQPRGGYCEVRGLRRESLHLREMMLKLGVTPHVSKLRDFKSAAEMFTEDGMTAPARAQAQRLLEATWREVTTTVARERGLSEADLLSIMEHASLMPSEAAEAGLIDQVLYWQDLEAQLVARAGGKDEDEDKVLPTISAARYREVDWSKLGPKGRQTVAVVHAQGMIGGRESGVNPLLGLTMGHETIVRELQRARRDEKVAAIVLRVDSPGGDALTSDLIKHEVSLCAAAKPTVVSMVDVAASGGYMISYHASKLLANPLTVTGSIGSISAMFDAGRLHGKLGIDKDGVSIGPMADLGRDDRPPTEDEWRAFEAAHVAGYEDWLRDVAARRGLTYETARGLADGRVFTGNEAVASGLIDGLGNLQAAIREAASLAEIAPETPLQVRHLPARSSPLEQMLGGGSGSGAVASWLRWELYRLLRADVQETTRLLQADAVWRE
jgi:protease IV